MDTLDIPDFFPISGINTIKLSKCYICGEEIASQESLSQISLGEAYNLVVHTECKQAFLERINA